jgi:short subunit dehydrogenase
MSARNQIALVPPGSFAAGTVIARLVRRSRRFDFAGRAVIITGGSRGLGLLVARQLAEAGALLTIAARNSDELEIARSQLIACGADVHVGCDSHHAPSALWAHPQRLVHRWKNRRTAPRALLRKQVRARRPLRINEGRTGKGSHLRHNRVPWSDENGFAIQCLLQRPLPRGIRLSQWTN